jgi:hypothetical protein
MVEIQAPRPTDLLPIGEIVRRTGVAAAAPGAAPPRAHLPQPP